MFGRWVAALIVVGLAIGVWALWTEPDTATTTTTAAEAAPTTVTTSPPTSTTTSANTTTAAVGELIDTVEEAETVLRTFWFGWFEGIYNQDEERIKEVVASQTLLDAARDQFGVMTFTEAPTPGGIALSDTEILVSTESCLVLWANVQSDFRAGGTQLVHVFRHIDQWMLVSHWQRKADLWEQDCEALIEPLS